MYSYVVVVGKVGGFGVVISCVGTGMCVGGLQVV